MTKPVILKPTNQKINKRQTIAGFRSKILKFCPRIKTFLHMLEKDVFFCKIQDDYIEYPRNTQNPCEKTNIGRANFQNCPERLKNYNCI